MQEFNFKSTALVDVSAEASIEELEAHHDAPGVADFAAKTRKLALWLTAEIIKKGFSADQPCIDEGGWTIDVSPDDHGYILCNISAIGNDIFSFYLIVTKIGDANPDIFVKSVTEILRGATEITELIVVDD